MDLATIILYTYDLCDEIKRESVFLELKELNKIISLKYKEEISNFNNVKEKYSLVSKYGDFVPGSKEIRNELVDIKKTLYNKEEIRLLKEKESDIQRILNKISDEIKNSISKKIKTYNELGFHTGCCKLEDTNDK